MPLDQWRRPCPICGLPLTGAVCRTADQTRVKHVVCAEEEFVQEESGMAGICTRAYRGGDAHGRPGVWFSFVYDPAVIDELKGLRPDLRSYSGERREWWVADDPDALAFVVSLVPGFAAFLAQMPPPGLEATP